MRASRVLMATAALVWAAVATAQPLGSFSWQLQPFCNRLTVTVTQNGGIYTLDGTDDQCGAAQKAPLVGVAAPNPDGSIGFGLNIVSPSGQPVPVQARITVSTLSGTWRDNGGQSGTFAFGGALPGLPPRPTPTAAGDITEVTAGSGLTGGGTAGAVTLSVDPAVVQSRVTTACPTGEAIRTINQDGTAVCQAATGSGGGDITAVNPGLGLTGGGTTGDVTLHVVFGGDGAQAAAARADHEHATAAVRTVGVGPAAALTATGGDNTAVGDSALRLAAANASSSTAVGAQALELNNNDNNTAVGARALQAATGASNTAVGTGALDALTTGNGNTVAGRTALSDLTSGSGNVAVGLNAGATPTTATDITLLGARSDAASGLTNATAIGVAARVDRDNALVLGSVQGVNGATLGTDVAIGTTSPLQSRLHVLSTTTDSVVRLERISASDTGPHITSLRARGTPAARTAVLEGDRLLTVVARGHTGALFNGGAFLFVEAAEDFTPTAGGARWRFFTTANGTQTTPERLRIEQDGRVGIGTTTPADLLHVSGDLRVGTSGTNGCVKRADGNVLVGACSSDARFKRDVAPFAPALEHVARLRPVHFYWRADAFPARRFGATQAYGLVAQDVEAVLPELVSTDAEGFKTVDYTKLPLLAIQAITELKARVDALQDEKAAVDARLAALESAILQRR